MAIANYREQKRLLSQLWLSESEKPLLLVVGAGGQGKTTLLKEFLDALPDGVKCVRFKFRDRGVGVIEILNRVGDCVGWDNFPNFSTQVDKLNESPTIYVDRNVQLGSNNLIEVALNTSSWKEKNLRRALLTQAWFLDIEKLSGSILLVLDEYEHMPRDVADWFEGAFLARAVKIKNMRIVVAGRCVPDHKNIEWGNWCSRCTLTGIHNPNDWLLLVDAMNRRIDTESRFSWLEAVCHVLDGKPKSIMEVIEALPMRDASYGN